MLAVAEAYTYEYASLGMTDYSLIGEVRVT